MKKREHWQKVTRGKKSSPKGSPNASPLGTPPKSPVLSSLRPKRSTGTSTRSRNNSVGSTVTPTSSQDSDSASTFTKTSSQDSFTPAVSSLDDHDSHSTTIASSDKLTRENADKNKGKRYEQVTEILLQKVASELPRDSWRWVFRKLMKNDPLADIYLQDIESSHENDHREQRFKALLKWRNCMGDRATVSDLENALRECNCGHLADKYTKNLKSCQQPNKISAPPETKNKNPVIKIEIGGHTIETSAQEGVVTVRLPQLSRGLCATEGDNQNEKLAVALLDSVINPLQGKHLYKNKLNHVADLFKQKYGDKFNFKHLGVGKLKNFIRQSQWFKLTCDELGVLYVEQCTPPTRRPSLNQSSGDILTLSCRPSSVRASESSSDESELEGYATCRSKFDGETPCPSPIDLHRSSSRESHSSKFQFGTAPRDTTPWRGVGKKGKHAHLRKNLFQTKSEATCLQNFESISSSRLKILLGKPPSKTLKFCLEAEYYDDAKFSLDIVSMWNTPDRQSSYIVMGVAPNSSPPHKLVGLPNDVEHIDADYQAKFVKECFSYRPPYQYMETSLDGKRYGVIVIPSSQGYNKDDDDDDDGEPCYAETNNQDGLWHQNDVWYYKPGNTTANIKNMQKILKWFSSIQSPRHHKKDKFSEESHQAWSLFSEQVGEFDHRKAYSLVLSRCSTETTYLDALGNFPWTKVFDFDPESRDSGTLNKCELLMANRITVSTWNEDATDSLCDASTDWVFVRGLRSRDDTMVETKKVREWWSRVGKSIGAHCKQLMRHCETRPLTVVILWYGNFDFLTHLSRLLMKIDEYVKDTNFVLCMPNIPGSDDHKANVHSLCKQCDIEKVVDIPLNRLCFEITQCGYSIQPQRGLRNQLPVAEDTCDSTISERDASWLRQEMDVLYEDEVVHDENIHHNAMGQEFFRGGLLGWSEADLGIYDAKRNITDDLMSQLKTYIDRGTSCIVTLYHEPGAGCTTLSRRILWDLHSYTPCVSLTSTTLKVKDVCDRLDFLYQKTHLPLVVLIDGKEICLVQELFQRCQDCHLLILCVQRFTREISTTRKGNRHWLKGQVVLTEAAKLKQAFANGSNATQMQRRQLTDVVEEVREGLPHFVYEFGLIVHAEKYRGIVSYVKGYLNLNLQNGLQPWQQAVAYLALVTFYSHSSFPCQFFAALFGMKQSEVVTTDVLTHNGNQFVLEDGRKLTWKITHHVVAKEILEQVLSPNSQDSARRDDGACNRLSVSARKGVRSLAQQFIRYVSDQTKRKTYDPYSAVMTVVRTMFIHRDYRETGHDNVGQRRQRISRLLADVHEHPSENNENGYYGKEKLTIMQQLAVSFPEDPLFSAHYGRALGISNRYEEALEHVENARSLRLKQMKTFHSSDKKDKTDSTLSTIHHILGIIYHKRIIDLIGGGKLSKRSYAINPKLKDDEYLQSLLNKVVALAKVAVGHFRKCRDFCSKGMDESYGYLGEIELRLHFADFLQVNCGGFISFLEVQNEDIADVHMFAETCFQDVGNLLQQYEDKCMSITDELAQCLNWYYALFHDAATALKYWNKNESIEGRRSKISVLKIKHAKKGRGKQNYAAALDAFQSEDDVREIVGLYEKNIDDVCLGSVPIDVSLDLRDWMLAIRHRLQSKVYKIETDVLPRVQQCYNSLPKSYTTLYYLYVLNTVLAMQPHSSVRYFAESNRLREELKMMRIHLPRLQRLMALEWVGVIRNRGIHHLVHRSSLGTWDSEQRFWKDQSVLEKMQIFRGTIVSCTNTMHGVIQISTGRTSGKHTFPAVFIPKVSHLYGKMHKNKEVEFFIGFNIEHGIGAYDVRELKMVRCSFCANTVLASTLVDSECNKCHRVVRARKQ